jgi:beta-1,4-mannosyltransferase
MPVTVFPWPDWMENPYLPRFCGALADHGVVVRRCASLRRGVARLGPGDWLHLHWPAHATLHPWRMIYRLRRCRLRRLLARLRAHGVRLAWTVHNLLPHDDPHPDLGRACRRDLLAATDAVFVHFPAARGSLLAELGYGGPVVVIPHGHYIDDYPPPPPRADARRELDLPPDAFVPLVFGMLRPYKGLAEVIAGFHRIARPVDRLLVVGKPEGDMSGELALAQGDPRIRLETRHVPPAEVSRYFAAADVFVAAYRATFTSGSAVLALSLACPVLAPAVNHLAPGGGEPHVYDVEPTAAGVAAGLERLRSGPPIDRPALREWARTSLGWDEIGARAARVFRGEGAG